MKKRFGAMLLVLCMVLSLVPMTALAADGEESNLIEVPTDQLVIDANGVCSGIQLQWFNEHKPESGHYLKITIPSTVKKIEKNAFYNFKNLGNNTYLGTVIGEVDFSQATNLEEIGEAAFSYQSNLSGEINLSKTKVKLIDASAFRETALTGVILPSTLESLGSVANGGSSFTECKQLQYVRTADSNATFELPSTLTYVGGYTFRHSFANTVEVKLPESVETIGSEAFNSGKITQIVVERTANYAGFNAKAVYGAGMAVFKDMAAYNAFADSISSSYKSNLTYPIQLTYQDTGITQIKLNKKSIQYELNDTTGFWEQNTNYTLPELSASSGVPEGFTAQWKLNGAELTNASILNVTGESATATYDLALAAPTIQFTKNGEVQDSNKISVALSKNKTQSVGIKLSHPLLDKELGEGEDIAVFYYWQDMKNWSDGPRKTDDPTVFYKWNREMAEIPITALDHARTGNDCYRVYFQLGYEKDGKTYWYKRTSNPITINVSVTQTPEVTLTYKLSDDDTAPTTQTVEKGEIITAQPAPTKEGYVFDGWKTGDTVYYAGQPFTASADTTFTAQWTKVEEWTDTDKNKDLDVSVEVAVNVDVDIVENTNADVSDTSKTTLSDNAEGALQSILKGETPSGITDTDAQAVRDLLNMGAPSTKVQLTISAELQGDLNENQSAIELASGETAQVWNLSVAMAVTNKDSSDTEIGKSNTINISELTAPIEFTLTSGQDLSNKTVRVQYLHDGEVKTADSTITDAAKGIVTIKASKFSPYAILSKTRHSSSSSSGTTTYPVAVADKAPAGGTVRVDRTSAAKGTTVTVTATAEKGYAVGSVTVTGKDGQAVAVTAKDGKYTFVMPAQGVTVAAVFKADAAPSGDWDLGYRGCLKDSSCPIAPFADAQATAWYHDGVHFCLENGLMVGTGTGIFQPGASTSRAMLSVMLWRLNGSPVVNYAMPFTDVAENSWYGEAVRWAASEGIVTGYDAQTFGPNHNVTREQMVTILYRYAQTKGYDVSVGENTNLLSYADAASVSAYATPAMQWACGSGLVQGTDNRLDPQGSTTRAQMATMMMRFCAEITK